MQSIQSFFKNIYQNFNARNIDLVIAHMTDNVQWANGMDGGYVYGHDSVRAYWTKQFEVWVQMLRLYKLMKKTML